MAKYLDYDGLTRVWGKIESSFLRLTGGTLSGPLEISTGSLNSSYNEGLRITKANNNWAGITFGSTGLSGAPSGGWFAALNPSGQFIISPDSSSNTTGLTLNKAGDLKWRDNKVWHAGNDGSGSGLDADTLDGSHSSVFMRYGDYLMPTNPFASTRDLKINLINNGFYATDQRATVTITRGNGSTVDSIKSRLFDGNYDNYISIPAGDTLTILIDSGTTPLFGSYSYGTTYVSFYYTYIPESVSMRVYGTHGSPATTEWVSLSGGIDPKSGTSSNVIWYFNNSGIYSATKWEITITAKSDKDAYVTQLDHKFSRGATVYMPVVTKFAIKQDLYGDIEAPKFIKRGGTSSQFLKADGSVDSNTYSTTSHVHSYLPLSGGALTGALSISKNVPSLLTLYRTDAAGGAFIDMYHNGQTSESWRVGSNQDGIFTLYKNAADCYFCVTRDGKVGIGTLSPTQALDISGSAKATSFIKSGSSNSYVLLGGGGTATISSLNVASAQSVPTMSTSDIDTICTT